jgi:hypothetical protein
MKILCKNCGKEFEGNHKTKYCSPACCKVVKNKWRLEYYYKHKEKMKEYRQTYAKNNPEYIAILRHAGYLRSKERRKGL